jgi:RNA polymerase sigma-70 factor (ECF subfamily)
VFPSFDETLRQESGQVVATLTRLTGSIDRAEDAFAEAVIEALKRWPVDGMPARPGAWLTTVARRKAIDALRRESTRGDREVAAMSLLEMDEPLAYNTIRDDQLRLIFTCCHPALAIESRVALALRVLCGLTTAEIAQAFLVPEQTMGKRITRAKAKIKANRIGYRVPPDNELPARLSAVLAVISLVFTTGHHAPAGATLVRVELTEEAIRLARLLADLMPDDPEVLGLIALLESTHARSTTRTAADGSIVLLADADRSRWDHEAIAGAVETLERALRQGHAGPYQLQAAISCLHSVAETRESTDWAQIVQLYELLEAQEPSDVVRVNRAIAIAELSGPAAGLALLDTINSADDWHFFHSARADMSRRIGDIAGARAAYERALACPRNELDRRFLERRIAELSASTGP